jgi:CPA2 family monovalent cation:H+ antiporter-2
LDISLRFLEELALLLLLAAGTAYVLARFHLPSLLGYLVAGLALGAGGTGIITQVEFVRALGDLGVILIMFGLGLDFELKRLRRTAALSILAGVASVLFTLVTINGAALLLGLSPLAALFLASALSICGSAVNLKILADLGHLKREYGTGIATTIVVTDIAAVLLLTSLSGIALGGGLAAGAIWISLLKTLAFLVLAPAFGFLVVPRLLNAVARGTRSREALLVTVLALCFGGAVLSQQMGFSLALGAFVVGMTASEARSIHRIEEMTKPLEHIFGTLFFFSVGLTADVRQATALWPTVVIAVFLIVVTKLVSVSSVTFLKGRNGMVALASAWALVPIGEFSFVIVNEGVRLGVLRPSSLAIVVVVCLLTSALAVIGLRNTGRTVTAMVERLPAGALNLMTLLQLRASAGAAVPGLAQVTAGLEPPRAAAHEARDADRERLWHEAQEIVIHAVIVITLVLGLSGLAGLLRERFPTLLGFPLALAGLAVILCAPSAVIIFHSGADLSRLVSEQIALRFPVVDARMLRGTLLAACTFLLVVLLEAALFPLVVVRLHGYGAEALVIAGSLTLVAGLVLWRSVLRLQKGVAGLVRHSLASAAARETEPALPPNPRSRTSRTMIVSLPVPADSWIVGRALEEVRLEGETGVTVLVRERDETWLGRPVGAIVVRTADEIVVVGSDEERMRAGLLVGSRQPRA